MPGKFWPRMAIGGLAVLAVTSTTEAQQRSQAQDQQQRQRQTIEQRTSAMRKLDGYFPLYWDEPEGKLYLEIPRFDTEVLYIAGLGAGLGSNDIGLDRGQLQGSQIVEFERVGPRVLMVQPNYEYRALTSDPAEQRTVRDAFARSVLWGFTVVAETDGRVLVDMTDFLIRDATNIAPRLRPGSYRMEPTRSTVFMPMTQNFPKNTEIEVELTFARQPAAGGQAGGGGGFFEGVGSVAANAEAASVRVHHSFVELPPPGYKPRKYDPRAGYFGFTYQNYAAKLGEPMTQRFISRHRLEKKDPNARVSDPVEPIIYYLDPGTPEPIRSALMEGARWWNQAFEAAGYRNAFRVELLPDSVSPLDIRYNVINWVHRSTRGWSYGASVTDPRTGEIIKGVVTLGSLRIRQDIMIAEGLLGPYANSAETPDAITEWGLARIRQLSAHEVGHTIGLGHNYYSSSAGRISVMDYPHPLVTLRNGSIEYADVYERGIGEWDSVAIAWGYQDFPDNVNEDEALDRILNDAWARDIRYMTNQDMAVHPRVDQWSNGTNAAAELDRMMQVRRAALARFGESAIKPGTPLATLEEVLVPLYLHHRYQLEAAGSALGGQHYIYAIRGDGREPWRWASADEQRAALRSILATIAPSELALPQSLLAKIPPRPAGYGRTRELFPRWTGGAFDAITPAVVATEHALSNVFDPQKAARLVEQHALHSDLPGLGEVIDQVYAATFGARTANPYEEEIRRATQRVAVEKVIALASNAQMPQVRAIATMKLQQWAASLAPDAATTTLAKASSDEEAAHRALLAIDIRRFLERPGENAVTPSIPVAPPGAPIGEPAMDWLSRVEPWCVWDWNHDERH